jgi:hypothetical protein
MPRLSSLKDRNLNGIGISPIPVPAIFSPYRLDNEILHPYSSSFGGVVAVSKDLLITGVPATWVNVVPNAGRAYIYRLSTGKLLFTLENPNAFGTTQADGFGGSVAIFGNYAVVGASSEDETGNTGSGKAYVFSTVTGQLLHTLNNPNAFGTPANDLFGDSCAISGTLIAITARGEDDAAGSDSGKIYIFDAVSGQLQRTIDNPNIFGPSSNTDQFGSYNIAMYGKYLAAPALREDANGTNSNTGIVYIFDVTTGERILTLNNPNAVGAADDTFGYVAISDKYVAVGTPNEDITGSNSGVVYIFDLYTGDLLRTINNPNIFDTTGNDYFGSSVAISNKYLYAAASGEDFPGNLSGVVYVFDILTGELLHTLTHPNLYPDLIPGAHYFRELAVTDRHVVVGAGNDTSPGFGPSSGKIYVYNSKLSLPYYPMLSIPTQMEVLKFDWNDGITNTADRSPFARPVYNTGTEHSVVNIIGPYGTTDNIYKNPTATSRIYMETLAGSTSNQYFIAENSWSIEWWGKYTWNGNALAKNVVWGDGIGGVGGSVVVSASSAGFDISLTWSLPNLVTEASQTFSNIPYNNDTWAHWVVAWEAITPTSGRFHVWINGVRCISEIVNKPINMDFLRSNDGTSFLYSPDANQVLSVDAVDYRILDNATVWTNTGPVFRVPTKSFGT